MAPREAAPAGGARGVRGAGREANGVREGASKGFLVLVCGASALSVGAALTNLWAAPALFVDAWGYDTLLWWSYAALYLLISAGQGFYGIALLRWPTQPVFIVGIVANVFVIILYAVTRAPEVPFLSPGGGYAGPVGALELLGVVAEVALIFSLVLLLRGRMRERVMTGLLLVGLGIWALLFFGMFS